MVVEPAMHDWQWKYRSEIDISAYELAAKKNKRSIYAQSLYLDTLAKNWGCYVLGNYQDVIPIAYTRYLGVCAPYLPNFMAFNCRVEDESLLHNLQKRIQDDWKYYDLHWQTSLSEWQNGKNYQWIDLKTQSEDNYSKNAKRQIKKAQKNELNITPTSDWKAIYELFVEYTYPKIESLGSNDLQYFYLLLARLHDDQQLISYGIFKGNEITGGGFYVKSENSIIYLKGAAQPEVMKMGGMFYLMHEVISKHKDQYKYFDFGGSAIPSIAEFNRKLNAQNSKSVYLCRGLPWTYRVMRSIYRFFRKNK